MSQPPERPQDPQPDRPDSTDRERYEQSQSQVRQTREEAEKLRQEALRLKAARRRALFDNIVDGERLLVGLLEILLGLRFFLRLSGANPDNIFAKAIYSLSEPFVAPFSTLFVSPTRSTEATIGQNVFDINLLIAMVAYGILYVVGIRIVRYIQKQVGNPTD